MTLEEQNEHANALMRIAATRHIQFAKQLIVLAEQHLATAVATTPASLKQQELKSVKNALLNAYYNLDRIL